MTTSDSIDAAPPSRPDVVTEPASPTPTPTPVSAIVEKRDPLGLAEWPEPNGFLAPLLQEGDNVTAWPPGLKERAGVIVEVAANILMKPHTVLTDEGRLLRVFELHMQRRR